MDEITEPQEWIDALVLQYSPIAEDIDVALQNMGLRIQSLEEENTRLRMLIKDIKFSLQTVLPYLDGSLMQIKEMEGE